MVKVKAYTKAEVILSWKEARQAGVIRATGPDGSYELPYEVVLNVSFDQQQVDMVD